MRRGVLAVDLAGVDPALEQQDGLAGGLGRGRGEGAVGRDDHERQLATLGGFPETRDPNDIGSARLDPAKKVHGFGMSRGRAEVGFFRHRLPSLWDLVGEGRAGSEGDEGDEAKQSFHGRHSSPSQFYRKGAKYAKDIADLTRRTIAVSPQRPQRSQRTSQEHRMIDPSHHRRF